MMKENGYQGWDPPERASELHRPLSQYLATSSSTRPWRVSTLRERKAIASTTDTNPSTTVACAKCGTTASNLGRTLKPCAKRKTTVYCTRECQKEDWKAHKKECAKLADSTTSSSTANAAPTPSAQVPKNLRVAIEKPFHKLDSRTWLHDRPEEDVYQLLIDTYRMRAEDEYKLEGKTDGDSIYGGAASGLGGFRRFIRLAQKQLGLLPPWWSPAKNTECEALGNGGGWSSLRSAVEKSDVMEYYGNPQMPMQLRMFGEQVYGSGPGGHNGASMRALMMQQESLGLHVSHVSLG